MKRYIFIQADAAMKSATAASNESLAEMLFDHLNFQETFDDKLNIS